MLGIHWHMNNNKNAKKGFWFILKFASSEQFPTAEQFIIFNGIQAKQG